MNALLRQALTMTALKAARDRVYENHGCAGVDGQTVQDFAARGDFALRSLAGDVLGDRYQPQALLRIWIPRPGKTPRGLGVPTVRDRVLQTAIAQALTPLAEHHAEDASFAYRQGRGHLQAVARVERLMREGWRWVVEADIESFFDTIDHPQLEALLGTLLPMEPRLRQLVALWLRVPISEQGVERVRTQGVPQGSPLSPLLSNLYLDKLDEALLDADHRLIRFADDFVVLARSRQRAEHALELSKGILESLALKLNPTKTRVVHSNQGFDFLGWNFVRTLAWPKARLAQASGPEQVPREWPGEASDVATAPKTIAATEGSQPGAETDGAPTPGLPYSLAETLPDAESETEGLEADDPSFAPDLLTPDADDEPALPALAPLQRTLYLVDPETRLEVDNQRLVVMKGERPLLSLSVLNVDHVIVFGPVQVTTQALQLAARAGTAVSFLSQMGRYYGRFEPADGSALGLLEAQFQRAREPAFALAIAQRLIAAKLRNSATVLARTLRRHTAIDAARAAATLQAPARQREWADGAERAESQASLRGIEGSAAALHFQTLRDLLPAEWGFTHRVPRPAPDAVNALLSFGYSMLYQCVGGLLRARGLHAHLGLFHASGGAHMALASDMMEPYRAYAVDATVMKLLFSGQLTPNNTGQMEDGRYRLGATAQRLFIRALETRFNAPQTHARTKEPVDFKRIVDADVRLLAAALRDGRAGDFWPATWD